MFLFTIIVQSTTENQVFPTFKAGNHPLSIIRHTSVMLEIILGISVDVGLCILCF